MFESHGDLEGALRTRYRDRSLRAGVIGPDTRIEADGVVTRIYDGDHRFPWRGLVLFDADEDVVVPLDGPDTARREIARRQSGPCPSGLAGIGVRLF